MKKTLLTFTLLAGLSSCTNLSEDLDMIGTQNITQTKSGNLSISENEPAIVKDLRNYISQIKLQGKQARVLTSYTLTPYIYKEDTIMYIANYEDGWETHQLGMNWGYDGSYDYLWLEASSYSDWVSNTTYDTERSMLK